MLKVEPGYVDHQYLATANDYFNQIKNHSYRLMNITPDAHVLDIGCGSGIDTHKLANLDTPPRSIIGVDHDPDMIAVAQETAHSMDYYQIEYFTASAYQLPFANNRFNAVRCERVFMHLENPELALAEAIRITAPGGHIVIVDTDWGSLSTHNTCPSTEFRLKQFSAEKILKNGYSGRQLKSLFSELMVIPTKEHDNSTKVAASSNFSLSLSTSITQNTFNQHPSEQTTPTQDKIENQTSSDLSDHHKISSLACTKTLFNLQLFTHAVVVNDYDTWKYLTQSDMIEEAAVNNGILSRQELNQWRTNLQVLQEKNQFFSTISVTTAHAQKAFDT
ncbi:methyltransferase domain-containing protein [Marinibactrum halimedae]|uniref:Methyltransferase domain-containing protein n=1 Tax=Marinibactrum halimedae TaxID=1444977 RepID=A0AA37WLF2_9GAMM|nr:methyltransferase domain-containing protein [Marinibactrum halimedae]MCD9459619.1 methyltransferase domain-containing protein [Marinibactrum halimedae]GLS25563.1 hypothetical protein GCM10007877_12770 [Marinibactrum halimedae]